MAAATAILIVLSLLMMRRIRVGHALLGFLVSGFQIINPYTLIIRSRHYQISSLSLLWHVLQCSVCASWLQQCTVSDGNK